MFNFSRRKIVKSGFMILVIGELLLATAISYARKVKQLRILVGFPVGGGSDRIARIFNEMFNRQGGLVSYVENKSGAGGLIAAQSLLQKNPQFETILLSHDHTISVLPLFPQNGNAKFITDITPIAGIATFSNAFAVSTKVPADTFSEYFRWVKSHGPAQLAVGIPAPNSIPEYLVKIISKHYAADLNPVAYRGSAPMLTDLLGNQISACVASIPELLEYQRAGYVRVLGVMGESRQIRLPNVPTFSELGLLGFEQLPYYGFFGAPSMNQESISHVEKIVASAIADTATRDKLSALGLDVQYRNTEQFKLQVQAYSQLWKRLIAAS